MSSWDFNREMITTHYTYVHGVGGFWGPEKGANRREFNKL